MGEDSFYAHPSSIVDEGAVIGEGTKIWHFCHIFGGAQIGKDCVLGQGCSVASTVSIGDGCRIQNGISLYDGVTLEDEVFIGPHAVFTNVSNPRAFISRKHEYKRTLIRKGATIGAGAVILCGIEIGEYAFVGAGAVVTQSIPDHILVYGNPARQHGRVDKNGVDRYE